MTSQTTSDVTGIFSEVIYTVYALYIQCIHSVYTQYIHCVYSAYSKFRVYILCEDSHIVEKVSNTQDEFTEAGQTSALPHT